MGVTRSDGTGAAAVFGSGTAETSAAEGAVAREDGGSFMSRRASNPSRPRANNAIEGLNSGIT